MKTLTKKILTVCLTLAMACALAIPAFADFDNGYNGYHIRNESSGSARCTYPAASSLPRPYWSISCSTILPASIPMRLRISAAPAMPVFLPLSIPSL